MYLALDKGASANAGNVNIQLWDHISHVWNQTHDFKDGVRVPRSSKATILCPFCFSWRSESNELLQVIWIDRSRLQIAARSLLCLDIWQSLSSVPDAQSYLARFVFLLARITLQNYFVGASHLRNNSIISAIRVIFRWRSWRLTSLTRWH